jgi:cell wall-associated NlpC family hydrolase
MRNFCSLCFLFFLCIFQVQAADTNLLSPSHTTFDFNTYPLPDSLRQLTQDSASYNLHFSGESPQAYADSLIHFATQYLGVPYRSGGTSARGFDCSGFTSHVFSKFGYTIPHSSAGQSLAGQPVNKDEVQKGDLIFFKGSNARSKNVGHVGIVISEKGEKIRFIHASINNGISIETIDSAYYRARYVKTIRLVQKTTAQNTKRIVFERIHAKTIRS